KWTELKDSGASKADRNKEMWDQFGTETITCMARGCRYLAAVWQAAWGEAGDAKIGEGTKRKEEDIEALYDNSDFLPSLRLDKYKLGTAFGASGVIGSGPVSADRELAGRHLPTSSTPAA